MSGRMPEGKLLDTGVFETSPTSKLSGPRYRWWVKADFAQEVLEAEIGYSLGGNAQFCYAVVGGREVYLLASKRTFTPAQLEDLISLSQIWLYWKSRLPADALYTTYQKLANRSITHPSTSIQL